MKSRWKPARLLSLPPLNKAFQRQTGIPTKFCKPLTVEDIRLGIQSLVVLLSVRSVHPFTHKPKQTPVKDVCLAYDKASGQLNLLKSSPDLGRG